MQIEKSVYELLHRVEEKQKEIQKECERTGKEFNVFELAGIGTKEVIMCRILRGLIARDATYGRGPYFLKMFVKHVLGLDMEDNELSTAEVRIEQHITENRRIDLVIETMYRFQTKSMETKWFIRRKNCPLTFGKRQKSGLTWTIQSIMKTQVLGYFGDACRRGMKDGRQNSKK